MNRRRVVITGVSAITPLGLDAKSTWEGIISGKSGIKKITRFDTTGFDTDIAGEVTDFNPEQFIPAKQCKRMDRFVQFSVCGAMQLMENSGYKITDENAEDVGVIVGVGLGGLETIEAFHAKLVDAGPSKVSPFFIPMLISNMAPGQVAIFTGAKGLNLVLTSACASATHAIGMAYTEIALGRAEAMITGGSEATITPMGISGFTSMKALCTKYNDTPEKASRPYDLNRGGFVMGEGTGMLFLESLDSALARNAYIYAEVVGAAGSDDAHHMVAPLDSGAGMASSMKRAIKDAQIEPWQINHINAHGTSTHANDAAETKAIYDVFGDHAKNIAICANKSQLGHLLGAAGGAESVISVLTLDSGMVPGTLNYETPDPECTLNYMGDGPKKLDPEYVICNSFGFGGTNGSVIYKKYTA